MRRTLKKPKNQRVKRALEKREPKIHENDKTTMFIKGGQTNETISKVLKELALLKKPLSNVYHRRNDKRPFEDPSTIEFFADKTDSSLFMYGCNSKKRPNNLITGRLFDQHILDMFEFGVQKFRSMKDFSTTKVMSGTKPCLVFTGDKFDSDPTFKRIRNLFTDMFRGAAVTQLRLSGVEHVYQFLANDEQILMRSYRVLLKKSGSRTPRVELEEIGPAMNLVLRRTHIASDDLYKLANKQPKTATPKKKKNISEDAFGTRLGRIHMTPQDIGKLQTRKIKGLKAKRKADEDAATTGDKGGPSSDKEAPAKEGVSPAVMTNGKKAKRARLSHDENMETN